MAKRFISTEIWGKKWFRTLPPTYKSFWIYLFGKCDISGVWEVDFDAATFHVGEEVKEEEALKFLKDKVVRLGGGKWWLVGFIDFQQGARLNYKSPCTAR